VHRRLARPEPDLLIERAHGGVVGHPRGLGELERVPELVPEERQPGVRLGQELQGDAHVAKGAGRRLQLGRRRGGAGEMPAAHVDDQVRAAETFEDGAERRRLLTAADDRGGQPRIGDAQERRTVRVGVRGRGTDHQQRGSGKRAPRARETKKSEQRWRCEVGSVHDESPVRPQRGAARRTSVRERRRRGRGFHLAPARRAGN
jgi:hypothetical protein